MKRVGGQVRDEQTFDSTGVQGGDDSLSTRDRRVILDVFNDTNANFAGQNEFIHTLFEEQAAKSPRAIAVSSGTAKLTYDELNQVANRLARHLRGIGAGPDQLVAIYAERGLEMVIGLLAILKSGAAYVPVDPDYPCERISYILRNAQVRLLLTQEHLKPLLPATDAKVVSIDVGGQCQSGSVDNIDPSDIGLHSRNLAYVIYTSGSTGEPKGAMNEHRGVVNRLLWMDHRYELTASDIVLQKTPFSFDVSVWEFFWTVIRGAHLVMARPQGHRDPNYLKQIVEKEGVTRVHFVPSMLEIFLDRIEPGACPSLTQVVCSGEALSSEVVRRCHEKLPHVRLSNLYGPTEAAVDVTAWECRADRQQDRVPIGIPISNVRIYLLDPGAQLLPIGSTGEIHLGGVAVGRGYLNQPALTALRFVPDPFCSDGGVRLYKTGDLGQWREDGAIDYLGRTDHQIKIRGFRIELGEIEATILRSKVVREVAVLAREDVPGEKRLIAYVVSNGADPPADQDSAHRPDELVRQWQSIYDHSYTSGQKSGAPSFAGWNSSYTGMPIAEVEMRNWLDETIQFIRELNPRRILEVGCGVGLLVQNLAAECDRYVATDISAVAVADLRAWLSSRLEFGAVSVSQRQAIDLKGISDSRFDTVILNSVSQHFPDINYLLSFVEQALDWTDVGGQIFIGDIRSKDLQVLFHTSVQFAKAQDDVTVQQLRARISRAVADEKQLLISPEFFRALGRHYRRISRVEIQLKRGRYTNELTAYRYDVVLHVEKEAWFDVADLVVQFDASSSVSCLPGLLSENQAELIHLTAVPNGRLESAKAISKIMDVSAGRVTLGEIRRSLSDIFSEGQDPEGFRDLGHRYGYKVSVLWSNSQPKEGDFDVHFEKPLRGRKRDLGLLDPGTEEVRWSKYANNPGSLQRRERLVAHLREFLRLNLPEYMVPAAFVVLDGMPLSANGKLDRRALPSPDFALASGRIYEAPIGQTEVSLANIWQELLRVDQIGRDDNFFELGGNSLHIMQMLDRLRQMNLSLDVGTVFKHPSVAALAPVLSSLGNENRSRLTNQLQRDNDTFEFERFSLVQLDKRQMDLIEASIPDGERAIQDIYPLTPSQQGIFFHHILNLDRGDTYVLSVLLSLEKVEVGTFIAAMQRVISRHDVLRTAVFWEGLAEPVQVVLRHAGLHPKELSFDSRAEAERELRARMIPGQLRLDLRTPPLIRVTISRLRDGSPLYALLHFHHLIHDNISLKLMLSEVRGILEGGERQLADPIPYRDHVARSIASGRSDDAERFFRRKLADVSETTAPFGLVDVLGEGIQMDERTESMETRLAERVRSQARELGVSVAAMFHAVWALVIARTSARDDVVFGTVLSGRLQARDRSESALGMKINTLPIRIRLGGSGARELVLQAHKELSELLEYEQTPLDVTQRCSGVLKPAPLFSSILNFLHGADLDVNRSSDARLVLEVIDVRGRTNYPIAMFVEDRGRDFVLTAQCDKRIRPDRLIEYLSTAMHSISEAICNAPGAYVTSLSVLPKWEVNTIVVDSNSTHSVYPRDKAIHEIFEEQVARSKNAVAAILGDESLSYLELNGKANELSRHLIQSGVRRGDSVVVMLPRSFSMLISQLAILKSGGMYVPIAASMPTERRALLVSDCDARLVIGEGPKPPWIQTDLVKWFDIVEPPLGPGDSTAEDTKVRVGGSDGCCVMYTSGSTGTPKGVIVPHRAIARLVLGTNYVSIQSTDCVVHASNPAFDASTFEVWGALLNGARIVIVPELVVLDGKGFAGELQRSRATVLWISIGLLTQHATALKPAIPRLRYLITGGDVVDPRVAAQILDNGAPEHLLNAYGPTECATFSTTFRLERILADAPSLPIGRPISNTRIYILDAQLQAVPIGVKGEIYIGGDGLGMGYINRPKLTAERFVADPFGRDSRDRLYKSGDLGLWLSDGNIEFLGRSDNQIKIRGFRIEPGEIEATLRQHHSVADALVSVRADTHDGKYLVAYAVARPEHAPLPIDLRSHLERTLPEYMIPRAFVVLERFPLNASGKVDLAALPAPGLSALVGRAYKAPAGQLEITLEKIWRDLLRLERIGADDNLFDLGGHSMLVISALAKIAEICRISLKVTDVYRCPTIRQIALLVSERNTGDRLVNLSEEARLDPSICPKELRIGPQGDSILLTGSTGFVGRFVLEELLNKTSRNIHCLVRCRSELQGLNRLRSILKKWRLWRGDHDNRLFVVPGDLRLARFGIDEKAYERLSGEIGAVFHCATSMNHLETYAMAKASNVRGSVELLRFATAGQLKLINYISTLGVFSPNEEQERVVDEDTSIDLERHYVSDGYTSSKWVGEKLFMIAAQRGIPCNIFRLGLVWPDAQRGRYDELQHGYRLLKSCFLSGIGIKGYRPDMPPTPVDYVARSIVHLAGAYGQGDGRFHLSSIRGMPHGLFECINKLLAEPLKLLEFSDWKREMKKLHSEGLSLPVLPLLDVYNYEIGLQSPKVRYESSKTRRQLDYAGIPVLEVGDTELKLLIEAMFERDKELRRVSAPGFATAKLLSGS